MSIFGIFCFNFFFFSLASLLSAATNPSKTVVVNYLPDTLPFPNQCTNGSTGAASHCNLRSAWQACIDSQPLSSCVIHLPNHAQIGMNTSFGELRLTINTNSIFHVVGNNAIVSSLSWSMIESRFLQVNASTHSTNAATLFFENMTFAGFGGRVIDKGGTIFIEGNCALKMVNIAIDSSIAIMGGGIYLTNNTSPVIIENSNFYSNLALQYGGGIALDIHVTNVSIMNTMFHYNVANVSGGGLFANEDNHHLTFQGVTMTHCRARFGNGGGINLEQYNNYFYITDSVFQYCQAGNISATGGAINLHNDNLYSRITYTQISYCSAFNAAGISIFTNNHYAIVDHVSVYDCPSSHSGIMIYTSNYHTTVSNSIFRDMIATGNAAGLYYYTNNDNGLVSNCTFNNLKTIRLGGGAMMLFGLHDNFTITDSTMTNCHTISAYSGGGALYIKQQNTNFKIIRTTFADCSSAKSDGGCIFIATLNDQLSIVNSTFRNCSVYNGRSGGAIMLRYLNTNFTIENSYIGQSHASGNGGGIMIYQANPNVKILDSQFEGNSATLYGGGIVANSNNTGLIIAGSTINNNTATLSGGGVYIVYDHNNLAIMDKDGYDNYQVIQSTHPVISHSPTNGVPYTIFNQTISVPGAREFIINFDKQTSICPTDTFYLYNQYNKVVFSSNVAFPGVTLPSLTLKGSKLRIVLNGPTDPTLHVVNTCYGFMMYLYPVMESPGKPTKIVSNTAGYEGGGIYMLYNNLFSVITNIDISHNIAQGSGGGLFLQSVNGGLSLQRLNFTYNVANKDGGAIGFLSGQFGTRVKECFLAHNVADRDGGAAAITTGNGNGLLQAGNEVLIDSSMFYNNSASNGGGCFIDNSNIVTFNKCPMINNSATYGNGGALTINTGNTVLITTCSVFSNIAKSCGGGIASISSNVLSLVDVNSTSNTALDGGGWCIMGGSIVKLGGTSAVTGNIAKTLGGGISLINSPMWTAISKATVMALIISYNTANRGSALFVQALKDPNSNPITGVTFRNNHALVGGTVYWLYQSLMTQEPLGLRSSTNSFYNNIASYGIVAATQAITIVTPPEYNVTVYSAPVVPSIQITLRDYYSQFIPVNETTFVVASVAEGTVSQCKGSYPYLSGPDMFGNGILMNHGIANFASLEAYCAPEGNMTISFQAKLGLAAGVGEHVGSLFYISNTTFLRFRGCISGEYIAGGVCVECPTGSYSLLADSTKCHSCIGTTGVRSCHSDQLVLRQGYWRRSPTHNTILSCLLGTASCPGGNMTGNEACAIGYTGELCAVCSDGYFKSDGVCLECSEKHQFTSPLIVFLCFSIVFIGILGWIWWSTFCGTQNPLSSPKQITKVDVFFIWLRSQIGDTIARIKVIVATMQVVTSISSVVSVTLPATFNAFVSSFKIFNLNITSIFPLGCGEKFTFMDSLLWTTMFPILVAGLLFIGFIIEYLYHRRMIQANKYRKKGEKAAKFNATKEKYLNYWFYLTYIILPSVATTIFRTFICTDVDPNHEDSGGSDYYLVADMRISCDSDYYYDWVVYACVMVVVYPIGVSLLYFYLLYQNRQEISSRYLNGGGSGRESRSSSVVNPILVAGVSAQMGYAVTPVSRPVSFRWSERRGTLDSDRDSAMTDAVVIGSLSPRAARLAFLWQSYAPQYWYWEVIETTRRIMLTAVLSVCSPGSSAQSVLGVLLALGYIRLYSHFSPYNKEDISILAETGQFQIFFSFFTVLIIQSELLGSAWYDTLGALLIILNLSVITMAIYFQGRSYQRDMEKAKKVADDHERAKTLRALEEDGGGSDSNKEKMSMFGLSIRQRSSSEDVYSIRSTDVSVKDSGDEKSSIQKSGEDEGMEMVEMTNIVRDIVRET